MEELKNYYNTNADFKKYVDSIMRDYNWSLEKALTSPITVAYYKFITST